MEIQRVLASYLTGDRLSSTITIMDKRPPITPLNNINAVHIRFKELKVIDNHTSFISWDSPADVYALAFAVNDVSQKTYDISTAGIFNGIKDNDDLPSVSQLDIVRTFNNPPHFLDIHVLVLKSSQKKRDLAKSVNDALSSPEGAGFSSTLNTAISNSAAGEILHVTTSLLSHITTVISLDEDEQLFYGILCLEDDPDDLGIGKSWVLTDNKNVRVTFEVVGKFGDKTNSLRG
jgi:hypothetical protein